MNKKLFGAVLSAIFFIAYFGGLLLLFTAAGIISKDVPLPLFLLFIVILAVPLVGIYRIREIKGGEEEEAKKY